MKVDEVLRWKKYYDYRKYNDETRDFRFWIFIEAIFRKERNERKKKNILIIANSFRDETTV